MEDRSQRRVRRPIGGWRLASGHARPRPRAAASGRNVCRSHGSSGASASTESSVSTIASSRPMRSSAASASSSPSASATACRNPRGDGLDVPPVEVHGQHARTCRLVRAWRRAARTCRRRPARTRRTAKTALIGRSARGETALSSRSRPHNRRRPATARRSPRRGNRSDERSLSRMQLDRNSAATWAGELTTTRRDTPPRARILLRGYAGRRRRGQPCTT